MIFKIINQTYQMYQTYVPYLSYTFNEYLPPTSNHFCKKCDELFSRLTLHVQSFIKIKIYRLAISCKQLKLSIYLQYNYMNFF